MKMPFFDDVITHNTTVLTIFGRISMVCTNLELLLLLLLIPIMSIKVKLGWVGLVGHGSPSSSCQFCRVSF